MSLVECYGDTEGDGYFHKAIFFLQRVLWQDDDLMDVKMIGCIWVRLHLLGRNPNHTCCNGESRSGWIGVCGGCYEMQTVVCVFNISNDDTYISQEETSYVAEIS